MTRPHEETWDVPDDESNALTIRRRDIGMMFLERAEGDAVGRAKLASQAPAMARLLLDGMCFRHCPACGAKVDRTVPMPGRSEDEDFSHRSESGCHAPDCRLIAVLRAAGVIE